MLHLCEQIFYYFKKDLKIVNSINATLIFNFSQPLNYEINTKQSTSY